MGSQLAGGQKKLVGGQEKDLAGLNFPGPFLRCLLACAKYISTNIH